MFEILKKMGLPVALAAAFAGIIMIIPMLFKIDERYAKTEELAAANNLLAAQINDISIEVGKLAGTTQVLVAVMSAKTNNIVAEENHVARPVTVLVTPSTADSPQRALTPRNPGEAETQLSYVSAELKQTQEKIRMQQISGAQQKAASSKH